MKSEVFKCASQSRRMSPAAIEVLESRRFFHAVIPAGYTALQTVQIRPAAGTYSTDLVLNAKVNYFIEATGVTRTAANAYHGDAAFLTGTTSQTPTSPTETAAWGITATVGTTSTATTAWGSYQSDHIYGQTLTPKTKGTLSFSFANDGLDTVSTLAVTIYQPPPTVPAVKVATIGKGDVVSGSVAVASLPSKQIFLPVDSAGAANFGKLLLPITLPAVAGSTSKSHTFIKAPHGLRVWLKPNGTGSTVNVGIRSNKPRTVYVEGTAEQPKGASVNLRVLLPIGGAQVEQDVPITVFTIVGPTTAVGGSKQVFSSDATAIGKWQSAVGGNLNATDTPKKGKVTFANVVWNHTTGIGFANFQADSDYLWGWPVEVTA